MHFDDIMLTKKYDSQKAYCQSKLANILFTKGLAERLKGTLPRSTPWRSKSGTGHSLWNSHNQRVDTKLTLHRNGSVCVRRAPGGRSNRAGPPPERINQPNDSRLVPLLWPLFLQNGRNGRPNDNLLRHRRRHGATHWQILQVYILDAKSKS